MTCIIFGGSGYIGTKLTEYFIQAARFNKILIADINKPSISDPQVEYMYCDVRNEISFPSSTDEIGWIFNFAAIHREPGHQSSEYFNTNILGAENICTFAAKIDCKNLFFTSSISVYGPTLQPTDELNLTMPNTPYGISKLTAEYIQRLWAVQKHDRRFISVRPGVIYGPGDPGNILRMIRAVKRGYFFLPTKPSIKKSYGYIYGLLDSISFVMNLDDKTITYNYVEKETESLGDMIQIINNSLGFRGKLIQVPFKLLQFVAWLLYKMNSNLNGIHPDRVKKVATPTHIIPRVLITMGFKFNYDLRKSLLHWKSVSSTDW